MQKLIIAIDGPVGSGKSTLARRVAEMMGYVYMDTGAMYRALALKALRQHLAFEGDDDTLVALAQKTSIDLRADDGTQRVLLDRRGRDRGDSHAGSFAGGVEDRGEPGVRHVLVAEQRRAGERGGVVMEGRDIGSVVFPDAELKIFLRLRRKRARNGAGASTHRKATPSICKRRSMKFTSATGAISSGRTSPLVRARRRGGGGQHGDGAGRSGAAGRAAGQRRRGPRRPAK